MEWMIEWMKMSKMVRPSFPFRCKPCASLRLLPIICFVAVDDNDAGTSSEATNGKEKKGKAFISL